MYLDATPTQKETRNSLFTSLKGCILREKWVNSIKKKDFIPGEQHRVCSQHFHGAQQGTSDVLIILPLLSQSKQKKPPKNTLAT